MFDAQRTNSRTAVLPAWLRTLVIGRKPKRTLLRIGVLVAATLLIRQFVLLPVRVYGPSMLPTYQQDGLNFINRLPYYFHEPRRGDVVAIRTSDTTIMYMKRIVGLPGETVAFHDGRLFINGQMLSEPYVKYPCNWDYDPVTLGSNQFFVVGDNRSMPQIYHEFGRTDRNRIVGRIF